MYQNYPLVDNSYGFKSVLLVSLGYRLYQSTLHTLDSSIYHGLIAFIYAGSYLMNNIQLALLIAECLDLSDLAL
jgi:hypothetical protein